METKPKSGKSDAVARAKARARELNSQAPPKVVRPLSSDEVGGQPTPLIDPMQQQPGPMRIGEFMDQGRARQSDIENRRRSKEKILEDMQALNTAAGQYQQESAGKTSESPTSSTTAEPEDTSADEEPNALLDLLRGDETDDLLNNEVNRRRVEQDLAEMDFENYLLTGEVVQEVTLRQGFRITYRSLTTGEDLEIKRLMYGIKGSDRYVNDLYAIRCLAASLFKVNDKPLPSHLGENQKLSEPLLLTKVDHVFRWSVHLTRYAYVNFVWFDERVQKMVAGIGEKLGNG